MHRTADSDLVDGIYASHISCSVFGHDNERWTAYMAVDIWHNGQDIDRDSVTALEDIDGHFSDPLTDGEPIILAETIWVPRRYFLKVVEARFNHISMEYQNLWDNIEPLIQDLVSVPPILCYPADNVRPKVSRGMNELTRSQPKPREKTTGKHSKITVVESAKPVSFYAQSASP